MAGKKRKQQYPTTVYPQRILQPEDLLRFIELKPFTAGWEELGLDDDDLHTLQWLIIHNPKGAPVVAGTGGLRKVRFSSAQWRKGKSGAARICYAYLEQYGVVLLVIVYAKTDREDLTLKERKSIRQLLQKIEQEFDEGILN